MHKEYINVDGKTVITDDNGNISIRNYFNNQDEILSEENLIEYLESRKNNIESLLSKTSNKKYIAKGLTTAIVTNLSMPFLVSLVNSEILKNIVIEMFDLNPANTDPNYCLAKFVQLITGIAYALVLPEEIADYKKHKDYNKNRNALQSQFEYINKRLKKEKELLKRLNENKNIDESIIENVSKNVDNSKIDEVKLMLLLLHDLTYDINYYYSLYNGRYFDFFIGEKYGEDKIEPARKFVKENGPILTLK